MAISTNLVRPFTLVFCIFTLGFIVVSARCAPVWRNIGPGGGGWVPCMAVSPVESKVVYAGCDVGGFYKSTDSGATWRICNTGLHDYYVEVIVPHPRDPKIIYIGTQGGIHKSLDGGLSWTTLRTGFPSIDKYKYTAPIGALAIDPQNPNVLYAGIGRPRWGDCGQGAIYRTDNAGEHWQLVNPGGGGMEPSAIVSDLVVHNGKSGRVYAATNKGLYRSIDSGVTWRLIVTGLPQKHTRRIVLCRKRPETMYVSLQNPPGKNPWQGGVYRSDDGGDTWISRSVGLSTRVGKPGEPAEMTSNIDHLVVDPGNPEIVYAGDCAWVSAGVYRTADGGASWKIVTEPRSDRMDYGWISMWGPSVTGLAIDPNMPGTLYFSTCGHIFRTQDSGVRWHTAYTAKAARPAGATESKSGWWTSTGLETTCLNSVTVHPRDANRLYVGYYDIGLLQSFDGGRSFTQTVIGMTHQGNTFAVAFDPDNPKIVYAGTGEWGSNHGDVCRSDDGGFIWKVTGKPDTGLPDGQTHHLFVDASSPSIARRIYVSVEGAGVYFSEDGGGTWKARNEGLPKTSIKALVQHPRDPRTLFGLMNGSPTAGGGIYKSTDRGTTWQRTCRECPWSNVNAMVVCPTDPKRIYVAAREDYTEGILFPGGVFASRDGGVTWARILEDRFSQSLAVDPRDANVVYAGGNDNPYHDEAIGTGVSRSRDGGKTWVSMNTPELANRNITSLTIDSRQPDRIYVGTAGNGVFVYGP